METPALDVLSDVLQTIKLSGVIFLRAHLGGAFGLEIPPSTLFHPFVKRKSEEHRLVNFHIVREGGGYVQIEDGPAERLDQGDLVLVFDDVTHSMVDRPGRTTSPNSEVVPTVLDRTLPPEAYIGEGERTMRLVCGMLQFVERGINPIFSALPPFLIVRAAAGPSSPWLQANLNYIISVAESGRLGSSGLLSRLTELMFIETLRVYLEGIPQSEHGWLAALKDPMVGPALQMLHEHPETPWTVSHLARRVGASRSSFCARFTELLDTAPITYLYRWRIRLATNLLEDSDASIAQIGAQVGYASESAFHRAFKREMGTSPLAFRERIKGRRQSALP